MADCVTPIRQNPCNDKQRPTTTRLDYDNVMEIRVTTDGIESTPPEEGGGIKPCLDPYVEHYPRKHLPPGNTNQHRFRCRMDCPRADIPPIAYCTQSHHTHAKRTPNSGHQRSSPEGPRQMGARSNGSRLRFWDIPHMRGQVSPDLPVRYRGPTPLGGPASVAFPRSSACVAAPLSSAHSPHEEPPTAQATHKVWHLPWCW